MILRLIALYILLVISFWAKSNQKLVQQADSLFGSQKYTEAFDIYENLFESGQTSPAMLLRMAFIKDGLGNYADALYYLDLYYKRSADKSVVEKIEEISEEQSLSGYDYDDTHFFIAALSKYFSQIQWVLLAMTAAITAYIFRKRKQNERPITATILQLVVLVALLLLTNESYEKEQGIISQNNTLLRSGPSAGAEPVQIIGKGHKVKILKRDQVWTKINWDGEEVFVRNGKIKII